MKQKKQSTKKNAVFSIKKTIFEKLKIKNIFICLFGRKNRYHYC